MDDLNVYFVDDDAVVLRAISQALRKSGFNVLTYSSAAELIRAHNPDAKGCILADLQMPEIDGLELQKVIRESANPLPFVFLTASGDIPASVRAMRHGAEDFLAKGTPHEELVAAINRALQRSEHERNARTKKSKMQKTLALLSAREREVLEHVVQGKLNKQIADDLGIHERTVKLHRTSITNKLGMPSVAELTKFWMEACL